jgi:hypothetical protein
VLQEGAQEKKKSPERSGLFNPFNLFTESTTSRSHRFNVHQGITITARSKPGAEFD